MVASGFARWLRVVVVVAIAGCGGGDGGGIGATGGGGARAGNGGGGGGAGSGGGAAIGGAAGSGNGGNAGTSGAGGGAGAGTTGSSGSGGSGGSGGAAGGAAAGRGGSGGSAGAGGRGGSSGAGGAAGAGGSGGAAGAGGRGGSAGAGGIGGSAGVGGVGPAGAGGRGGSSGAGGSSATGGRGGAGGAGGSSGAGGVGGSAGVGGADGGSSGAGGAAGAGGSGAMGGVSAIWRASVSSDGVEGNGESEWPSLSADGQVVAFHSSATNLVAGDSNGHSDIFVHDVRTRTTVRASVDSAGGQGNKHSFNPALSANGRFVAFESESDNLVSGDTNGAADIFLRDLQTGTTRRATVDSSGTQANSASYLPTISSDGRFVGFMSYATNLAGVDSNGAVDVYVHDFQTGATLRASVDSAGNQAVSGNSWAPSLSADGRLVAYHSYADNLTGETFDSFANIYVHDLQTRTTRRVTADTAGNQPNNECYYPSLSGDGRFVSFWGAATNLVSGDTNLRIDSFVRNIQAGTTARASVSSAGVQTDTDTGQRSSMSTTGRFVAFHSRGTNLVSNGGDGTIEHVFVRDLQAGTTVRASVNGAGDPANASCIDPSLSGDGRFVAFVSFATNLVSGDVGGHFDIFVVPVP